MKRMISVLAILVLCVNLFVPAQTGDNSKIGLWITVMALSVVALGALLVVPAVSKKRQER